ncbi:MAG: superoxide dismutase [Coxiella sp. (in: Bacteria)]|nr:MAG: superoxide dismutase [Coxiella sp. (in: g-proteobacteria)]
MKRILFGFILGLTVSAALAGSVTVAVNRTTKDGKGAALGTVTFKDSCYGLLIEPKLHGLKPGLHGFHIHQKPDCGNNGLNASGHFDPDHTGKHLGPFNSGGHLGDLPALYVNNKGQAIHPTLAPRLRVRDLYDHSIMVHEGGDNYSDTPEKLGGGGKRIGCGVILKEQPKSVKK